MELTLLHAHHQRYQEDIPFWLDIADQVGSPILELGCGTGRVLQPLAEAGHQVYGLDTDWNALNFLAKTSPPEIHRNLRLLQADLANFHLGIRFRAILLPCNTLSTINADQLVPVFNNIHHHLEPAGIFAASLLNPYLLENLPEDDEPEIEDIYSHPVDGEPVQVTSSWAQSQYTFDLTWHYDHLLPDGSVQRTSVKTSHFPVPLTGYLQALDQAGFKRIDRYGDFAREPHRPHSPHLILVAAK